MKQILISSLLLGCSLVCAQPMLAQKNQMPLVFSVENIGAKYAEPKYGTADQLPEMTTLPNPFLFANGKKQI